MGLGEIGQECSRLEEDAVHSSKAHLATAARWSTVHLFLGIPSTLVAALAGVSALQQNTQVAAVLALTAAVLTGISTFLNPERRASSHLAAGSRYLELRNKTRLFRSVQLGDIQEPGVATEKLVALCTRRDELNSDSPQIPRWAFKKAKKGIVTGEASYESESSASLAAEHPDAVDQ